MKILTLLESNKLSRAEQLNIAKITDKDELIKYLFQWFPNYQIDPDIAHYILTRPYFMVSIIGFDDKSGFGTFGKIIQYEDLLDRLLDNSTLKKKYIEYYNRAKRNFKTAGTAYAKANEMYTADKSRDPKLEKIIAQTPSDAYGFLTQVIKQRDPVLEKSFMKDPMTAYNYACYIEQRWPEAEPYIMQNPKVASLYWQEVINIDIPHEDWHNPKIVVKPIRWPEAEPYIKQDPKSWDFYSWKCNLD
jgi:hypothetical protein